MSTMFFSLSTGVLKNYTHTHTYKNLFSHIFQKTKRGDFSHKVRKMQHTFFLNLFLNNIFIFHIFASIFVSFLTLTIYIYIRTLTNFLSRRTFNAGET